MVAYEHRFRYFHPRTLALTDDLFNARPSANQDVAACLCWLTLAAETYGLDGPSLTIDGSRSSGIGCYRPARHEIVLPYVSVMTLLHEFRHAMQQTADALRTINSGPVVGPPEEQDARAWSMSLYRTVRPRLFERLMSEGRLLYGTTR